MSKKLSVIGGDLRIVKLAQMLVEDEYTIHTYALEQAESLKNNEKIKMCKSLSDAISESEVIIGPVPLSSNSKDINTPFSNEKVTIEELVSNLTNKTFIAGNIKEDIYSLAQDRNIKIYDLLQREELAVLNTISTAEGAIQIAMQETSKTIHGSNVLILGFGRIGKITAKMLAGIGANVSCEARKNSDIAWIKAYGYTPVLLNELNENLQKYDIIINTIPALILDEERLELLKQECLVIDLASNPGGVDKNKAKQLGIKLIWALSLPGKVAPLTSAEFIKETIYNIFKENE